MGNFTRSLLATCMMLSGCLVSSCNKEAPLPDTDPYVSVMNASPTGATYYLYLNGSKATSGALSLGGFVTYQQVSAGNLAVKLTNGTTNELLLERTFTTDVNNAYSLFIIGKDQQRDLLLIGDKFPEVSSEKSYLRFINLSPEAAPLDLLLDDSTMLAGGQSYKAASDFVSIDPGTYSFAINQSGTDLQQYQLTAQKLEAGRVYSIVALGLNNPGDTERGFTAELITNY